MSKMVKVINDSLTKEEKKSFESWKKKKNIPNRIDFYDLYLWAKATNQNRILGLLELASMIECR